MSSILKSKSTAIGLAMFSMFFGAGNIIYPLAIGQYAGDKNLFAMIGLILTAVIMPIAGVIAMILFDGNYKQFFGRLGHIPGFILALTTISLLGPLGSTPRCIALSYTTLKTSFFEMPSIAFSAFACGLIFVFSLKKKHILNLLGWILTPLLLSSLLAIIILGLFTAPAPTIVSEHPLELFLHGLVEGYNTMDLLAAFFFSSTIIHLLKSHMIKEGSNEHGYLNIAMRASIVSAFLLTAIYIGFSFIASYHGSDMAVNGKDQLLAALTVKIAGSYAGVLVCITIALACLTTAIALIAAFTDFMQREIFKDKLSYEMILSGALLITFAISTFEFNGISAFLWPILQVFYPGLIVLTFLNIAHQLWGWRTLKIPVFLTFAISAIAYLM